MVAQQADSACERGDRAASELWRVTAVVHGTGVAVRLATEDEVRAVEKARHGHEFALAPSRSHRLAVPVRPLADGEVLVVSQAFVEFSRGSSLERWADCEHHGHAVPTNRDATLELLRLADETAEDLVDILSDLRIAGLGVSRWEIMSARRRVELDPRLAARLVPLRRG